MISLYKYRLPFKQPFKLAGMSLRDREGIIVQYSQGPIEEHTEVAPLPGFSTETLDKALTSMASNMDAIIHHATTMDLNAWDGWLHSAGLPTSVRFGLDMLIHRIRAAKQGVSLHRLLNPLAPDKVGTNAVMGIIPASEMETRTSKLVDEGYRTVKYKVEDPVPYLDAWMRIRTAHPHLAMRFDANGSWSQDNAEHWARLLEPIRPQYLEQPLGDGYEPQMVELQRHIDYPIAFDESARDLASITSILEANTNPLLILKPSLLGSVKEISGIIDAIRSRGVRFTVTTLMEGGIGRNNVASVAAAFSEEGHDHGLGTGSLFVDDVLTDLGITDGYYTVDADPSSRINLRLLESFRIH